MSKSQSSPLSFLKNKKAIAIIVIVILAIAGLLMSKSFLASNSDFSSPDNGSDDSGQLIGTISEVSPSASAYYEDPADYIKQVLSSYQDGNDDNEALSQVSLMNNGEGIGQPKVADVMTVMDTVVDSSFEYSTIDDLWSNKSDPDSDISDQYTHLKANGTGVIPLYKVNGLDGYYVGKADTLASRSKSDLTFLEAIAGRNDKSGTVYDDVIYDSNSGLVFVPTSYSDGQGNGVRLQILWRENTDNNTVSVPINVVDGTESTNYVATTSIVDTGLRIPIVSLGISDPKSIKTISFNGTAFNSDDDVYEIAEDAKGQPILVLPYDATSIDSVQIIVDSSLSLPVLKKKPEKASAASFNSLGEWYIIDGSEPKQGSGQINSWNDYTSSQDANAFQRGEGIVGLSANDDTVLNNLAYEIYYCSDLKPTDLDNMVESSSSNGLLSYYVWQVTIYGNVEISGVTYSVPNTTVLLKCTHLGLSADMNTITDNKYDPNGPSPTHNARISIMNTTYDNASGYYILTIGVLTPTGNTQAGTGFFQVRVKPVKGTVTLSKSGPTSSLLNISSGSVPGAKFSIYKSDGTYVTSVTTDANGNASTELEKGSYYFQEESAQSPYISVSRQYPFDVQPNETTTVNASDPTYTPIKFKKQIRPQDGTYEASTGSGLKTSIIISDDGKNYDATITAPASDKTQTVTFNGAVRPPASCNLPQQGVSVHGRSLSFGPSPNERTINFQTTTVTETSKVINGSNVNIVTKDDGGFPLSSSDSIMSVASLDSGDGNTATVDVYRSAADGSGTSYGIYSDEACTKNIISASVDSSTGEFTWNTWNNNHHNPVLEPGTTYYAKEISSNDAYILNPDIYQFTVPQSTTESGEVPQFVVTFTDTYRSLPVQKSVDDKAKAIVEANPGKYSLEGAKYALYPTEKLAKENNQSAAKAIFTTDSSGSFVLPNVDIPTSGSYYLREIQAPQGFIIKNTIVEVTHDSTTESISEQLKEPIPVRISLDKSAEDGQISDEGIWSLEGAMIGVFSSQSDASSKSNPIAIFKTDKDGHAILWSYSSLLDDVTIAAIRGQGMIGTSDYVLLPFPESGSYYYAEIDPPENGGYQISNQVSELQFSSSDSASLSMRGNITDKISPKSLFIEKSSNSQDSSMAGGAFSDMSGCVIAVFKDKDKAESVRNELIATDKTKLEEVEDWNDYLKNTLNIDADDYQIYITDSTGTVEQELKFDGSYPSVYTYELRAPKNYQVDYSENVHTLTFTNSTKLSDSWADSPNSVSIKVTKKPVTDDSSITGADLLKVGKSVKGTQIGIYKDESCSTIYDAITIDDVDENGVGTAELDNIPAGPYWVREISPADGFTPSSDIIPITFGKDAELLATATLTNMFDTGHVKLQKVSDDDTATPDTAPNAYSYKDAVFAVYGSKDEADALTTDGIDSGTLGTVLFYLKTGDDGIADSDVSSSLTDRNGDGTTTDYGTLPVKDNDGNYKVTLAPGDVYYAREIKAPKGYFLSSQRIDLPVKQSQDSSSLNGTVQTSPAKATNDASKTSDAAVSQYQSIPLSKASSVPPLGASILALSNSYETIHNDDSSTDESNDSSRSKGLLPTAEADYIAPPTPVTTLDTFGTEETSSPDFGGAARSESSSDRTAFYELGEHTNTTPIVNGAVYKIAPYMTDDTQDQLSGKYVTGGVSQDLGSYNADGIKYGDIMNDSPSPIADWNEGGLKDWWSARLYSADDKDSSNGSMVSNNTGNFTQLMAAGNDNLSLTAMNNNPLLQTQYQIAYFQQFNFIRQPMTQSTDHNVYYIGLSTYGSRPKDGSNGVNARMLSYTSANARYDTNDENRIYVNDDIDSENAGYARAAAITLHAPEMVDKSNGSHVTLYSSKQDDARVINSTYHGQPEFYEQPDGGWYSSWRIDKAIQDGGDSSVCIAANNSPRTACDSKNPDDTNGMVWFGSGMMLGRPASGSAEGYPVALNPRKTDTSYHDDNGNGYFGNSIGDGRWTLQRCYYNIDYELGYGLSNDEKEALNKNYAVQLPELLPDYMKNTDGDATHQKTYQKDWLRGTLGVEYWGLKYPDLPVANVTNSDADGLIYRKWYHAGAWKEIKTMNSEYNDISPDVRIAFGGTHNYDLVRVDGDVVVMAPDWQANTLTLRLNVMTGQNEGYRYSGTTKVPYSATDGVTISSGLIISKNNNNLTDQYGRTLTRTGEWHVKNEGGELINDSFDSCDLLWKAIKEAGGCDKDSEDSVDWESKANSTLDLYADYEPSDYVIVYDDGSGNDGSKDYQIVPSNEDWQLKANTLSKSGFKFAGWSTTNQAAGSYGASVVFVDGESGTAGSEKLDKLADGNKVIHLYPVWAKDIQIDTSAVVVKDSPIGTYIRIIKRNVDNGVNDVDPATFDGAVFDLYDASTNQVVDSKTVSNGDGMVKFSGIIAGRSYYAKERTAPSNGKWLVNGDTIQIGAIADQTVKDVNVDEPSNKHVVDIEVRKDVDGGFVDSLAYGDADGENVFDDWYSSQYENFNGAVFKLYGSHEDAVRDMNALDVQTVSNKLSVDFSYTIIGSGSDPVDLYVREVSGPSSGLYENPASSGDVEKWIQKVSLTSDNIVNSKAVNPITFYETPKSTDIYIMKDGADMRLRAYDDWSSLDGTVFGVYRVSDNQRVTSVTISGGSASVHGLPDIDGGYYLKEESSGNKNYAERSGNIPLTEISSDPTVKEYEAHVEDLPVTLTLKIHKVGVDGDNNELSADDLRNQGLSLGGAKFGVYTDSACTKPMKDPADKSADVVITTNQYGDGSSALLPRGKYYVKEISGPTSGGWKINSNVFPADATQSTYDDQTDIQLPITVQEPMSFTTLCLNKITNENAPGEGAVFAVYDDIDMTNQVGSITTDDLGFGESGNLPDNKTYYLQEIKPLDGYSINRDDNFFICEPDDYGEVHHAVRNSDGTVTKGESAIKSPVINSRGKIQFKKNLGVSASDISKKGIAFKVFSDVACKNLVDTFVTDEDGNTEAKNISYGTYYVTEDRTNADKRIGNPLTPTPIKMTVDESGISVDGITNGLSVSNDDGVSVLSITDSVSMPDIVLKLAKQSSESGDALSGATFRISKLSNPDENLNDVDYWSEFVSDFDGIDFVNDEPLSSSSMSFRDRIKQMMLNDNDVFVIEETQAPTGYVKTNQKIYLRYDEQKEAFVKMNVNASGQLEDDSNVSVVTINVDNTPVRANISFHKDQVTGGVEATRHGSAMPFMITRLNSDLTVSNDSERHVVLTDANGDYDSSKAYGDGFNGLDRYRMMGADGDTRDSIDGEIDDEGHLIVSTTRIDSDGQSATTIDTNQLGRTWFTSNNGQQYDANKDSRLGSFPVGTYKVSEMKIRSNRIMELPSDFYFKVNTNGSVTYYQGLNVDANGTLSLGDVKSGTPMLTNNLSEIESTSAVSDNTGTRHGISSFSGNTDSVTDTVRYRGLVPGKEYVVVSRPIVVPDVNDTHGQFDSLKGLKEDKVVDENVRPAASVTFTPTSASGSVSVTLNLDGTENVQGKIITFQTAIKDASSGVTLATHNDSYDDADETVRFPGIKTKATSVDASGKDTGTQSGDPSTNNDYSNVGEGEEPEHYVNVNDKVSLTNLDDDSKYYVKGVLHKAHYNGNVAVDDGVLQDIDGKDIETKSEVFSSTNGDNDTQTVTIKFGKHQVESLPANVVVFEYLYNDSNVLVASHEDIGDKEQTIDFPQIKTIATDNTSTDTAGLHTGSTSGAGSQPLAVNIVDVVSCDVELGKEYVLNSSLMKKDGTPAVDSEGNPITVTQSFKASSQWVQAGSRISVSFNSVPARPGDEFVVYEELRDSNGNVVAVHQDATDESQTVRYPLVSTTFTTEDKKGKAISGSSSVDLVDTVSYSGLIPGETYYLDGDIMVKDGSSVSKLSSTQPNASVSKFSFVPTSSSGTVEVKFSGIDTSQLVGKKLVAYEKLYVRDSRTNNPRPVEVASHEDSNDQGQTIEVKNLAVIIPLTGKKGIIPIVIVLLAASTGFLIYSKRKKREAQEAAKHMESF